MKLLASLLVVVICISYTTARLSGDQKEMLQRYGRQCSSIVNVSEDDLEEIRSGTLENIGFNSMCWLECVFERIGILNDGVIQTAAIMSSLTSMGYDLDTATSITFMCESPKGINACERAHSLALCYLKNNAALHNRKK